MRKDKNRRVIGRVLAPPALPVEIPLATAGAEHVAAHDERPGRDDCLDFGHIVFASLEHPFMDALDIAVAEGFLKRLVRARGEAIDRHRYVTRNLAHRIAFLSVRSLQDDWSKPKRSSVGPSSRRPISF